MCGRFTLTSTPESLAERFDLDTPPVLSPRYNIAPGQDVIAVRVGAGSERTAAPLRWGLVPSWARSRDIGHRTINARAETLATKPAFREAFRRRRCLLPADGFYEWAERAGTKQPYRIGRADGALFAFAGLWERWRDPEGDVLESCSIVTCEAAPVLRDLHDRMPVILELAGEAAWLDPDESADVLHELLRPAEDASLGFHPVSTRVNRTEVDDPECAVSVPEPPRQETLF